MEFVLAWMRIRASSGGRKPRGKKTGRHWSPPLCSPNAATEPVPENVKDQIVREREYRSLTVQAEHITDWAYRPTQAEKTYRMVVLRKTIAVKKGQRRLFNEVRYFFYVTNLATEKLSAAEVIGDNNQRCNQENLIEQLKNGVAALPEVL